MDTHIVLGDIRSHRSILTKCAFSSLLCMFKVI